MVFFYILEANFLNGSGKRMILRIATAIQPALLHGKRRETNVSLSVSKGEEIDIIDLLGSTGLYIVAKDRIHCQVLRNELGFQSFGAGTGKILKEDFFLEGIKAGVLNSRKKAGIMDIAVAIPPTGFGIMLGNTEILFSIG